jgi:hypothetical protein
MGDAGDVAKLLAVALVLASCEPRKLATRPSVDGIWSPYLATVVRGRSAAALDAPKCDSEFAGAVEDVLWARRHASLSQQQEIDTWLGGVAFTFFQQCYDFAGATVATMPSYWPWRRAEADYSTWLSAHSERMLQKIYTGDECRSDACTPFARRWPGFDELAAGLPVVNRWERSGHAPDREVDVVLCPRPLGEYGAEKRCGWFRHAMADPEATRRLAGILGSYDDPLLVRAVVSNSGRIPLERVVALWRALEPWPRMWREAGVTAADTLMEQQATQFPLLDEARRAYFTPEHGDVALYVLAREWTWTNARAGFFAQPWDKFAAAYGGPIGLPLFEKLLDLSPRSIDLVPIVWPALTKGESRVLPVLERLDAYLDDPNASMQTLLKIAGTVCQRGTKRELTELHDWLLRRAKPGSTHQDDVDSAASSTKPGHCTAPM